ncbi:MAG: hypothetical protein FWF30_02405, partial [Coriobacteriia bacterium]|nr:hypothetical protein [Coriobacteriia bacterium]
MTTLSTADGLASQINTAYSAAGLTAVASAGGSVVTVTGGTNTTATLALNIDAGVTVTWNAVFTGSIAGPLISLTGKGAFTTGAQASIVNSRNGATSDAISITGAGTVLTVDSGSMVGSDNGGIAVRVSANDVTVNVQPGGTVESMANSSNPAIQIENGTANAGLQGVVINVNGGSVLSTNSGYAINDGAGTGTVPNNTKINVNSGTVSAGSACAIHSIGTGSTTVVNGGTVTNAATNNANPVIYMNAGSDTNVRVTGGTIQPTAPAGSAASSGYAIQTTGNIEVTGGLISAENGRAINLVGSPAYTSPVATISGGTVQTTGSGTAISTATTANVIANVADSEIKVTGGTVQALGSGTAVNVTGTHSTVTVSNGQVLANSGVAINADNTSAGPSGYPAIDVSGGTVSSTSGHAIYANGPNAAVAASGGTITVKSGSSSYAIRMTGENASVTLPYDSSNPRGAQVAVYRTGAAIYASGANAKVSIDGGFVFAYGTNATTAIATSPTGAITWPTTRGVVGVWNQANGRTVYAQSLPPAYGAPDLTPATSSSTQSLRWSINAALGGGGIWYVNSSTSGFFPFDKVLVAQDYGLIFDAATGVLYRDVAQTGVPVIGSEYPAQASAWASVVNPDGSGTYELVLRDGFVWDTAAPVALRVINGNATIVLEGSNNRLISETSSATGSYGIYSTANLTIEGSGSLVAAGSKSGSGTSHGIGCADLTFTSGTLESSGNSEAWAANSFTNAAAAYDYWQNASNADPGGTGTVYTGTSPFDTAFVYANQKFVRLNSEPLATIGDKVISGQMGTGLTAQVATVTLYNQTVASLFNGIDATGWFSRLPTGVTVKARAVDAQTIEFTFGGLPYEGSTAQLQLTVAGSVLSGGLDLAVQPNSNARFDIAPVYDLLIVRAIGGT